MGNKQNISSSPGAALSCYKNTEFLRDLLDKERDFTLSQCDNKFKFFWLSNVEDWDKIKAFQAECIWSPYDMEDCIFLEYWYQRFLKGEASSPRVGDYIIDYTEWIQYHHIDNRRRIAIIRAEPDKVSEIYRNARFEKGFSFKSFHVTKINQLNKSKNKAKLGLLDINVDYFNISEKFQPIEFNIIRNNSVKFKIQKYIFKYINANLLSISFKDYINSLKLEVKEISNKMNHFDFYNIFYLKDITENIFFRIIIKMFTEEGFLYKFVNKALREKNRSLIKQIKFYFTSLLVAFQFYSDKTIDLEQCKHYIPQETQKEIKENNRLYVYWGTYLTAEEIVSIHKEIETSGYIMKICDEFIYASLRKDLANKLANGSANCLIQLEINYEQSKSNYVFLNPELNNFTHDTEVLLRSGSIIKINKFKIQDDIKTNKSKNFYLIYGSLISLSLEEFTLPDLKREHLDLTGNNIGKNGQDMKLLADVLFLNKNPALLYLHLSSNKIAENPVNIITLSHALKANNSLIQLDLSNNSIGYDAEDLRRLVDALKSNTCLENLRLSSNNGIGSKSENLSLIADLLISNKSLKNLDLSNINIGSNTENMRFLADALKSNIFLEQLHLSSNAIGDNSENLRFLADAIKLNSTLKELDISNDCIGNNAQNIIFLSDALKSNNSLKILYLSWNSIGEDPENLRLLGDSLKANHSLKELNISSNHIGKHPEHMTLLSDLIISNTFLEKLNLMGNFIENDIQNLISLSHALKSNNSLKEVVLSLYNVGNNAQDLRLLGDCLTSNTMNFLVIPILSNLSFLSLILF